MEMDHPSSEDLFRRGLVAVDRGAYREALDCFETALENARAAGTEAAVMKYRSWFGWSLAMCSDRLKEARHICEAAARAGFYNPDAFWNLGRVYLKGGDRSRAFGAFARGLRLNPRHAGLVEEIRALGIRRRPVVSFFRRSHPLNRLLGMLRGAPRPTRRGRRRATAA